MRIALRVALACCVTAGPLCVDAAEAAPAKAPASISKTFENWTATCDNLIDCVVIGSSESDAGLFYLRLAREPAPAAEPALKIVLAATDPIPGSPGSIRVAVAGKSFVVAVKADDAAGAALAGPILDPSVLPEMERATTLDFAVGSEKGNLSLKGLAAALRFIDVRQGRYGTPDALIARGTTPFGGPSLPAPPIVKAADVVATPLPAPVLSRALLDMAKPACDPEVVEAHADAAAWTLGPDRRLVAVPCADSPTNVSVALFTTDAKGDQPRPAMLEQPPRQGDAEADNVVVNYDFDGRTLTLSSLDKGRGLGDCGSSRTWIWTGEIFALLKASELEACPGALPEDWPPVFAAVRQ